MAGMEFVIRLWTCCGFTFRSRSSTCEFQFETRFLPQQAANSLWPIGCVNSIRSHFGSSRPGLSFRCICHPGNPIKTLRVRFLFAVYIAWPLLLVAQLSSVENLVVLDLVRSPWWNMGTQLGKSQLCAGLAGRLSRARTSLCQTSYLSRAIRRRMRSSSRNSPAMSRRSNVVSWSDSPREQEANGDVAAMEDCTESHQAEIIKKIIANDQLLKILTNMLEEHK